VDAVIVVCHPDRVAEYRDAVAGFTAADTPVDFIAGGDTRQASVEAGVRAVADDETIVVVHDGARPFVTCESIARSVEVVASGRADGAVVAHPVSDTVKAVACGFVEETPERTRLWAVQTPQVFRAGTLRAALAAAEHDHFVGTDDASLVERAGGSVAIVEGARDNIKITHAEDVVLAEALLASRAEKGAAT
jgi:2-C-methyl-D-erythritol 4-phosphate cytidylyltransferase